MTEEAGIGINDPNKERAIKSFAQFGISLTPDQLEQVGPSYHDQLYALIDYKEGNSGNRSIVNVTFQPLLSQEEDFLEATRDIKHRSGLLIAGASCSAIVSNGEVTEYKVRFGSHKSGYVVELNPDGTIKRSYQEYSDKSDEYEDVVSSISRFPPFPTLLQRFVTTPIDSDQPTSVFSPEGLPNELVERKQIT